MCVVSMVMDRYKPWFPEPNTWPGTKEVFPNPYTPPYTPVVPYTPPKIQPIIDPDQLRELIDAFRDELKGAEKFDRLTGQPDCVDPEKQKLEERVAELEEKLAQIGEVAQS